MLLLRVLCILYLTKTLVACITAGEATGYSDRVLTIASIDLFSQQEQPRTGKSWSGDWQFRRDRLDLIDATFRDVRPDIVIMQNAMRRAGSVSESDELILKSGALGRYEWRDVTIETLSESGEDRLLAIAVARPLFPQKLPDSSRNYSRFGVDGHMLYLPIDVDGSPVIVFDIQMPSKLDQSGLWYSLIEERINEAVREFNSCIERVIVAGYLPFEQESRRFKDFLTSLRLKDSGSGFCQSADRCNTASPQNGIFLATRGDESASQVDRVMTHESSIVYGAGANFSRTVESSDYNNSYGISRIWPSQRYGWVARIRVPNCPKR